MQQLRERQQEAQFAEQQARRGSAVEPEQRTSGGRVASIQRGKGRSASNHGTLTAQHTTEAADTATIATQHNNTAGTRNTAPQLIQC